MDHLWKVSSSSLLWFCLQNPLNICWRTLYFVKWSQCNKGENSGIVLIGTSHGCVLSHHCSLCFRWIYQRPWLWIGVIFNSLSFIKLGQYWVLAGSEIGHRQAEWNMKCKQMFEREWGRHHGLNATFSVWSSKCKKSLWFFRTRLPIKAKPNSHWDPVCYQLLTHYIELIVSGDGGGKSCCIRYGAHVRSQRACLSDVHLPSFHLYLNRLLSPCCCELLGRALC